MSLFIWYFGTKKKYPQVPHHMMLLGKRYKELLDDIFKRHHLAKDFSLYLHRPTATDPSLAPEGCDTFYVLSPVPHLDSGTNWSEVSESYRKSIAKMLGETVLPDLEENLVESFVMTPQDFQDRLLSYKGAAFGLEPLLTHRVRGLDLTIVVKISKGFIWLVQVRTQGQVYLGYCLQQKHSTPSLRQQKW
jgi:phytoene desaturase